jgi:hypothetical protein
MNEKEFIKKYFLDNIRKNATFQPYRRFMKILTNKDYIGFSDVYVEKKIKRVSFKDGYRRVSMGLSEETVKAMKHYCHTIDPEVKVVYGGHYLSLCRKFSSEEFRAPVKFWCNIKERLR